MSNPTSDPFDEFEFKPLTDGLGFHKKSVNLKDGLKNSGVLQDALQPLPSSMPKMQADEMPAATLKKHSFEEVLSSLEKPARGAKSNKGGVSDLKFTEPLPREHKGKKAMEIETPRPVQSPFPQPGAYKSPAIKAKKVPTQTQLANVGTRRGAADSPQQRKLTPVTVSFESAILDLIIVMGLTLVFMVMLLLVTKVDLNVVFRNLNTDYMTQLSLGVLFLAVMQMYVVISRSFFGRTLGEWTFDLQMGEDDEQRLEVYPLKIAARSLLVTLTGLILLPLISAIMGRDIAGQITGIRLYKQA
jgi:hypothetical protein